MTNVERGKRLKELRLAADMLQRHVGAEFNIDKAAVSEWETGKSSPSRTRLLRLDEIYNANGEVLALYGVGVEPDDRVRKLETRMDRLSAVVERLGLVLEVELGLSRAELLGDAEWNTTPDEPAVHEDQRPAP